MNNSDKICMITGASSGIGLAIAKALHHDNYKVIATARRTDRLNQLQSSPINIFPGDLNLPDFQDSIENYVFDKYKKCDYLFNCAGTIEVGSIEEIDSDKLL